MCKDAHIDWNFEGNEVEILVTLHADYHTLFNSWPSWRAKIALAKEQFYSKNKNKIKKALDRLFGDVTSLEERYQILDEDWTPIIPVREMRKLWEYGQIDGPQLSSLHQLGKISGSELALAELLEDVQKFVQAA